MPGPHIDPHVHCRDWKESNKATISSVMKIAADNGVVAIFDMPNTNPPIISLRTAEERLLTAEKEGCTSGYYVYIGLTGDDLQAREAADAVDDNDRIVGIKMYAGRSVGSLSVSDPEAQAMSYAALAEAGYTGVVAVHCEKESLFKPSLWNPADPQTWNLARPPEMEVEAVREQIEFAEKSGFRGNLHICHISTPDSVDLVKEARGRIRVTCGATPHHLSMSTDNLHKEGGIAYKVNPPIRDLPFVSGLNDRLKKGMIDWIETDHAPHTKEEKSYPGNGTFMSGIPSLEGYSEFLEGLSAKGLSDRAIADLTYNNIKKAFPMVKE